VTFRESSRSRLDSFLYSILIRYTYTSKRTRPTRRRACFFSFFPKLSFCQNLRQAHSQFISFSPPLTRPTRSVVPPISYTSYHRILGRGVPVVIVDTIYLALSRSSALSGDSWLAPSADRIRDRTCSRSIATPFFFIFFFLFLDKKTYTHHQLHSKSKLNEKKLQNFTPTPQILHKKRLLSPKKT
jgi:hypothetical protein